LGYDPAPMPSLLFASHGFLFERSGGAEICTQHLLHLLLKRGWRCEALCGAVRVNPREGIEKILSDRGAAPLTLEHQSGPARFKIHHVNEEGLPALVYEPATLSQPQTVIEGYPFVQLLDQVLAKQRPDVMLTFGGNWLGRAVQAVAARHGVPVVFWLRHLRYEHADLFEKCDAIIVPSEFSVQYYRKKLGIDCDAVPAPIRLDRTLCPNPRPRFATFVAPNPDKGVFYFVRIAAELARLRPDIPLLVAVGRGNLQWLDKTGVNLRTLPNLQIMPAAKDARQFLSATRVLLAPALWNETFMRVGAEAMFNGIPVLASNRGAIPSTLGASGFLFDIPEKYQTESRIVPTAEEVEPWVETLIRLWDDEAFYTEHSGKSRQESKRFHPDLVIPMHERILLRAIDSGKPAPRQLRPLAEEILPLQKYFDEPMALERFNRDALL
jgi:glycosyltransferase involved in cell wall biosynthesis